MDKWERRGWVATAAAAFSAFALATQDPNIQKNFMDRAAEIQEAVYPELGQPDQTEPADYSHRR